MNSRKFSTFEVLGGPHDGATVTMPKGQYIAELAIPVRIRGSQRYYHIHQYVSKADSSVLYHNGMVQVIEK